MNDRCTGKSDSEGFCKCRQRQEAGSDRWSKDSINLKNPLRRRDRGAQCLVDGIQIFKLHFQRRLMPFYFFKLGFQAVF